MKKGRFIALFIALVLTLGAWADINPQATYVKDGVETTDWSNISGDAPLHVSFTANASALDPDAGIEWHITHRTSNTNLTRYEDTFEFDFTESGVTTVALYVRQDNELIDSSKIEITISESHLEMPNAFSPNDDGINDYYQAKTNHKSIISFHAYIFNRWGQKLYEWTDYTDEKKGWDGTFHGQPVKDGVYYVLVKARGADGREYNIRRDVNLLRRFNEVTTGGGGE